MSTQAELDDARIALEAQCLNCESPSAEQFFDYAYEASGLTYEDLDLYEMWYGKRFDEIDCSIATEGMYFSPFIWLNSAPEVATYYLAAGVRCFLLRYGEEELSGMLFNHLREVVPKDREGDALCADCYAAIERGLQVVADHPSLRCV